MRGCDGERTTVNIWPATTGGNGGGGGGGAEGAGYGLGVTEPQSVKPPDVTE